MTVYVLYLVFYGFNMSPTGLEISEFETKQACEIAAEKALTKLKKELLSKKNRKLLKDMREQHVNILAVCEQSEEI